MTALVDDRLAPHVTSLRAALEAVTAEQRRLAADLARATAAQHALEGAIAALEGGAKPAADAAPAPKRSRPVARKRPRRPRPETLEEFLRVLVQHDQPLTATQVADAALRDTTTTYQALHALRDDGRVRIAGSTGRSVLWSAMPDLAAS